MQHSSPKEYSELPEVCMSEYSLPYGATSLRFRLPGDWKVSILKPRDLPGLENPRASADEALKVSNADGRFSAGGERRNVSVAINDKTRPVPHDVLLPALIRALEGWGYRRSDITFVIAVGAHEPMKEDEYHIVVPEGAAEGCRIISHDSDDEAGLVYLGTSAAGTRCRANRVFIEADLRIVVGNIEPHQFMGWSGGSKSAVIGLGARDTIAANHSMMSLEGAGPCRYHDNPLRRDVDEMGRLIGVQLALNVVMNGRKEIVAVLAGDPDDVMREGIAVGEPLFTVPVPSPADLVIVSAGGYPKDLNFYQAQKALRGGVRAAAPGAPVLIVAACPEGVGSVHYENWMADKTSHEEVKAAFETEEFRLGHHKGMLVAGDALGREVYLVSELPDQTVRALLLEPCDSVESALEQIALCRGDRGGDPLHVAVIPYGNSTVPLPDLRI